jgi:hypothetical protein
LAGTGGGEAAVVVTGLLARGGWIAAGLVT